MADFSVIVWNSYNNLRVSISNSIGQNLPKGHLLPELGEDSYHLSVGFVLSRLLAQQLRKHYNTLRIAGK